MNDTLRPSLLEFAELMESRLKLHDEERGTNGWRNETIGWLLGRASEEFAEAGVALRNCDPLGLGREVADAANFLMMVHDKLTNR